MSKEFKLYHIYEDDSGHSYLIPKDEVNMFYSILDDLSESLASVRQPLFNELYEDNLSMILENYDRLEGEEYFVVLASELEGKV